MTQKEWLSDFARGVFDNGPEQHCFYLTDNAKAYLKEQDHLRGLGDGRLRDFIFGGEEGLDYLHGLVPTQNIIKSIEGMGNSTLNFAIKSEAEMMRHLFPRFSDPQWMRQDINVIIATTADAGEKIIRVVSDAKLLEDGTAEAQECRLAAEIPWPNRSKVDPQRGIDWRGRYLPEVCTIVIYIDRVFESKDPLTIFKATLAHEYAHALFDWRTRIALNSPKGDMPALMDIEEMLANAVVLSLIDNVRLGYRDHVDRYAIKEIVINDMKEQPRWYAKAVEWIKSRPRLSDYIARLIALDAKMECFAGVCKEVERSGAVVSPSLSF